MAHHAPAQASAWVQRWSHLLAPGSTVLDVACGSGRHMAWLQQQGHRVTGIDRDPDALRLAGRWGTVCQADLENGDPWPLPADAASPQQPQPFDAVVVTNYLWRPLFPTVFATLRQGGLLIYETFAAGHERFGRPRRPEFLLQPGELLRLALAQPAVRVLGFEEGLLTQPDRVVQSITLWVGDSVVNSQHLRPGQDVTK